MLIMTTSSRCGLFARRFPAGPVDVSYFCGLAVQISRQVWSGSGDLSRGAFNARAWNVASNSSMTSFAMVMPARQTSGSESIPLLIAPVKRRKASYMRVSRVSAAGVSRSVNKRVVPGVKFDMVFPPGVARRFPAGRVRYIEAVCIGAAWTSSSTTLRPSSVACFLPASVK